MDIKDLALKAQKKMKKMLLESGGKGSLLYSGRRPSRTVFCSYVDSRPPELIF